MDISARKQTIKTIWFICFNLLLQFHLLNGTKVMTKKCNKCRICSLFNSELSLSGFWYFQVIYITGNVLTSKLLSCESGDQALISLLCRCTGQFNSFSIFYCGHWSYPAEIILIERSSVYPEIEKFP